MQSITEWVGRAIQNQFPGVDLPPLPGKARGRLRLSPAEMLAVIHGQVLAEWAIGQALRLQPAQRLPRGPGGRAPRY